MDPFAVESWRPSRSCAIFASCDLGLDGQTSLQRCLDLVTWKADSPVPAKEAAVAVAS